MNKKSFIISNRFFSTQIYWILDGFCLLVINDSYINLISTISVGDSAEIYAVKVILNCHNKCLSADIVSENAERQFSNT